MFLSWLLVTIIPEGLNGSELSRPPRAEGCGGWTTWGRGLQGLDHLGQTFAEAGPPAAEGSLTTWDRMLQGPEKLMVKF